MLQFTSIIILQRPTCCAIPTFNNSPICFSESVNVLAVGSEAPVDSLRSAEFTRQHGLTASVMDNIMCNYIAQPEDVEKGAVLVQPGIGRII